MCRTDPGAARPCRQLVSTRKPRKPDHPRDRVGRAGDPGGPRVTACRLERRPPLRPRRPPSGRTRPYSARRGPCSTPWRMVTRSPPPARRRPLRPPAPRPRTGSAAGSPRRPGTRTRSSHPLAEAEPPRPPGPGLVVPDVAGDDDELLPATSVPGTRGPRSSDTSSPRPGAWARTVGRLPDNRRRSKPQTSRSVCVSSDPVDLAPQPPARSAGPRLRPIPPRSLRNPGSPSVVRCHSGILNDSEHIQILPGRP